MSHVSATQAARLWRVVGLIASFLIFSSPILSSRVRGESFPFVPATLALTFVIVGIVVTWREGAVDAEPGLMLRAGASAIITTAAVVACLAFAAWRWVDLILWSPYGSDMLLVVREGTRQFLRGHDPYGLYHVPWEAPLPYGPMLWAPFLVPQIIHADLRVVTIAGELFVPACCGIAAIVEAARGRVLAPAVWLAMLATIVFNPDLAIFTTGGHTPGYWPLLPLFAALVASHRWPAAALVLGLLIAGRSTMVSLVPIFFFAVWRAGRREAVAAFAIGLITIAALLLPFALWDFHAFWYGMVASYPRVIKQVVWPSADQGAIRTFGVTGWLLSHHLEALVETTQILLMAVVYLVAWRALKRGAPPLPWMGLALFAFTMTTLWPVFYVYFDVLLFLVSAAIVEPIGAARPRIQLAAWLTALASVSVLVAAMVVARTAAYPTIDLGGADGSRALHRGFSEIQSDGTRRFAWVRGLNATVIVPRRSASSADLVIAGQPVVAPGEPPQAIAVTINGSMVGTTFASAGWQALRFRAPRAVWRVGANEVQLSFAFAKPPADVGLGRDRQEAAFAIGRIDVIAEADKR